MATDKDELVRETANKLNKLFISRRDVKAIEARGEWFAKREEMTLGDFKNHLLTKSGCMGTYLLDQKSRIKFVAFDVDLTGPGAYYLIEDDPDPENYVGTTDFDARTGPWDECLHDDASDGYRWVRSALAGVVRLICTQVDAEMGLPSLPVITGGGAHILVPFGEKIPAVEGRVAAHGVMDKITSFNRTSDNFYTNAAEGTPQDPETKRPQGETMSIEVFPKQDQLSDSGALGNLIRLPFGWHSQAKMRTYIMDTRPQLPPWGLPKVNSMEALDEMLSHLGQ